MPSQLSTLEDHASHTASTILSRNNYDYIAGSAGDERTYRANAKAFAAIRFRPRCLVPVHTISTSTSLVPLGTLPIPLLIAPMAAHKLAHPAGELAVISAAKAENIPVIMSTNSTTSLEDMAAVGGTRLFQLYLFQDRSVTLQLLKRARSAGYKAVVLTVDAPVFGRRERDLKNNFHLPPHLTTVNFAAQLHESASGHKNGDKANGDSVYTPFYDVVEADLSPEVLRWVIKHAKLPVWVKGVVRGDDAEIAVEAGASAIVVSNHGGRQLAGCVATMEALPEVVAAVRGRVPVLVDSGIRSGEDVVRACALGASAVLLGRPVLWALAVGGEQGVRDLLGKYRMQVKTTMQLLGARTVKEITRDMVVVQHACKL